MSSSSLSNQGLQNRASAWSSCLAGCNDGDGVMPTNHQRSQVQTRDETEELLMSEFNKLSIYEQVKALDDIYSAGSELKENPVMIDKLLTEFEQQVERGNYPIYQLALNQDRSYVEDPSFRLKFLRANLHDVDKAVKQMISFLHQKTKYFGADKVARDITLDDLTPSDLKFMLSGAYHIQDGTDRNGRAIFYVLSSDSPEDMDSEIRVLYYIWFNILIPMHSVQMKGAVGIVYNLMKPGGETAGDMKCFVDFATSLPLRKSAFHLCIKREVAIAPIIQFCLRMLPKSIRERARVHHGSPVELHYQLSTYGIPQDTIPVDMDGNLRRGILNAWFYKHLASGGGMSRYFIANNYDDDDSSFSADGESSDEILASAGMVEEGADDEDDGLTSANPLLEGEQEVNNAPLPYSHQDVLLGRGYTVQNHPGNAAFRDFLREHQEEYDSAPRASRRHIARNLTRLLMANGVRFWQKTDGETWIETTFDEAEKKVGQIFRSVRKRINR